ncbi:MAG: hypothetical protein JWR72_1638 [Flavisolibacter sp.]|jgi:hypothetical protein|nr:hypothetical protein [Flavisolibacter sp.]
MIIVYLAAQCLVSINLVLIANHRSERIFVNKENHDLCQLPLLLSLTQEGKKK